MEEHIEQYRERLAKPPPVQESAPDLDYFQDMTPQIREQQKLFIATATEEERNFSRLQASRLADIPAVTNELKDWEELEQQQGWEEVDDESTKKLIRETRKELRNQKQRQKQ